MKKSEAVKAIAIAMNQGYGRDFNDLEYPMQIMDKQVSYLILQTLIKLGMVPRTVTTEKRFEWDMVKGEVEVDKPTMTYGWEEE